MLAYGFGFTQSVNAFRHGHNSSDLKSKNKKTKQNKTNKKSKKKKKKKTHKAYCVAWRKGIMSMFWRSHFTF